MASVAGNASERPFGTLLQQILEIPGLCSWQITGETALHGPVKLRIERMIVESEWDQQIKLSGYGAHRASADLLKGLGSLTGKELLREAYLIWVDNRDEAAIIPGSAYFSPTGALVMNPHCIKPVAESPAGERWHKRHGLAVCERCATSARLYRQKCRNG